MLPTETTTVTTRPLTTAANNALTLNITVPDGVEADREERQPHPHRHRAATATERTAAEQAGDVSDWRPQRQGRHRNQHCHADPIDVTLNVQDALDRYALILDDSDVDVDTIGNTVTLTGHVRTWAEHDAVIDAAWMAVGVYDVTDDLYVTG